MSQNNSGDIEIVMVWLDDNGQPVYKIREDLTEEDLEKSREFYKNNTAESFPPALT